MQNNIWSIIIALLILLIPASVFASGTCSEVAGAVAARYDEQNKKAAEIFDGMVTVPDKEALKSCLDGINVKDIFSIGLPSVSDWFSKVCDFINDKVGEQLAAYQQKLKYEPLPGFSVDASGGIKQSSSTSGISHTGDIRVKTNSASMSKVILKRIQE